MLSSDFWYFANERYALFENRLLTGIPVPSADPIMNENRFTNTFRATDRVSQRMIKLQYDGDWDPASLLLRTLLFKVFNREQTWDAIVEEFGEPTAHNWEPVAVQSLLDDMAAAGEQIFTGSYMMVNPLTAGWVKHHYYVNMIDTIMNSYMPIVLESQSLMDLTARLQDVPGIGKFLAYQYAIDLNYSTLFDFSENDYTLAGHGAKRGITRLFGNARLPETRIRELWEDRARGPELLGSREMHLIDIQNVLCEYDKYMRTAQPVGRKRMKQRYRPDPRPLPDPVFPPKWNL